MDKKKRIVLDAGDNTALFIEQENEGDYLAVMYPFKESNLVLKIWKSLAWSLSNSIVFSIAIAFLVYGMWSSFNSLLPGHSLLISFVMSGVFFGSVLFARHMFMTAKKEIKEKEPAFVRDILREMKSNSPQPIEQYSIKSSYLYNGIDGDFITWYKQEKNRENSVKRSRKAS